MSALERCCPSAALEDVAVAAACRSRAVPARIFVKKSNRWGFNLSLNASLNPRFARNKKSTSQRSAVPGSSLDVLSENRSSHGIEKEAQEGGGDDNKNGNGRGGDNGNGGGGDGRDAGDDEENTSSGQGFGSLLTADEIDKQVKARGAVLPADMAEAARTVGIRELILTRYLDLQAAPWPLGPAIRGSPLLRNRMLADPTFLFKVFTEVAIDSGCATFAEINKRGKDFWNEFELYLSDLLVGIVMDVALVSMLAPYVQFGATTSGGRSRMSRAIKGLPSSIFEAESPGRRFNVQQRLGSFFYKAIQYGAVGFVCGLIGQGFASSIMVLKRKMKKSEHEEVPVPPLLKSAALWAVFMGVSSNTRYQIINGLERVVEGSPVAKKVPLISMAFTVGVRFANNIYGGMQFVDWARLSGVQ